MRLIAFISALLISAAAWGQEPESNSRIVTYIEDQLSTDGRQIRLRGIDGLLASNATVDEITIADRQGVWLRIEDASIIWTRTALFRGRVEINELRAKRIRVLRRPVAERSLPSPEAQPFTLPEMPVSVNIGDLSVERLELGEKILGEPVNLAIKGSTALASGVVNAKLDMDRLDAAGGNFRLIAGYAQDSGEVDVFLRLKEPPAGLAVKTMGMPGLPALEMGVEGSGLVTDLALDIFMRTADRQNVSGKVVLAGRDDNTIGFEADLTGSIDNIVGESARPFFAGTSQIFATGAQRAGGGFDLDSFDIKTAAMTLTGTAAINGAGSLERAVARGRISNPAGATLLPIEGGEVSVRSVDLSLDYGNRPDGAWEATFNTRGLDLGTLEIGFSDIAVQGTTSRNPDGSARLVSAKATGSMGGFVADDPGVARALGDRIALDVETIWQGDQPFQIDRARLSGNGIDLDVAGRIEGLAFDGQIKAKARRLSPFSGLLNRRLSGGVDLSLAGRIAPTTGSFDLTTSGTSQNLRLGITELDRLLRGRTALSGQIVRDESGIKTRDFAVSNPQITLTSDGEIASDRADFGFEAALPDLSVIREELTGALRLSGSAKGDDGRISLSALTRLDDGSVLGRPLTGFRKVFDGRLADGVLQGNLRASGQLADAPIDLFALVELSNEQQSLENLRFLVGPSQITGRLLAKANVDAYEGELNIDARDISALAALFLQDAAGAVRANLKLTPTPRFGQQVGITADVSELSANDGALSVAKARMEAVIYDALNIPALIGSLTFSDLTAFGVDTKSGEATASYDGEKTQFDIASELEIGTKLDIGGTLGQSDQGASIELSRFNISQKDAVLGLRRNGRIEFAGPHLAKIDLGLSAGEGRLTATGAVTDEYDVTLTADRLPLTALNAVRPDLSATGDISGIVTVSGALASPKMIFAAEGRALGSAALRAADVPGFDVTLEGESEDQIVSINTVFKGPENLTSNLDGTYRLDTQALDLSGKLDRFPLALVDQFAGRIGLRGIVNGTFNVAGTVPDPDANFNLSGSGLSFNLMAQNAVSPFEVSASGTFKDQAINLPTSQFNSSSGANFQVTGTIPIFEDGLDVQVAGRLPLSLLNVPLASSGVRGEGIVNLSLAARGSLQAPQTSGSLSIADASFVLPRINLRIDGLAAQGRIADNRLQITQATARNSLGGQLSASGSVLLDVAQGLPSDLELAARDVSYTDGRIATADFNADLTFQGPLIRDPVLGGTIDVETVEVTIPKANGNAGPAAFALDLSHRNASGQVAATLRRAEGPQRQRQTSQRRSEIALDVTLNAPSRVFVRGRGLDGEVGGRLRVQGTVARPEPAGQLNLVRGRLQVLSQRIDLTSGTVIFDGALIPQLRLEAKTVTDDFEATVALEGKVTSPDIKLSSVPDLPEDEILARVAFGRPLSDLSPLQIAQVASAGAELAGRGELSFINRVRNATGLDDLDFETTETGGTMLRAGKYLQDNIYSSIEADNQGNSKAIINLDINSKVKARGSVDNYGNTSLGIFFERDY